MRLAIAILATTLLVAPAAAQRRELPVPADKGWQHATSGIVLTATLAGMPRTSLTDYGDAERDISAEFATPDRATVATIYIFHPALMSVPVWFDRAQTTLTLRDLYHGVTPASPQPVAFAPPGATKPTALRQIYVPGRGPFLATALAVVPVGEWLVAVRLSSKMLTVAAADAELSTLLAAIRWPKAPDTQPVAQPVLACADGLSFKKAKLKRPDMMQALLGGTIASIALKHDEKDAAASPAPLWCRDLIAPTQDYGVYRANGDQNGFTVAVADSGRVATIYKAMELPNEASTGGYAVSYGDLDGSIATFPSFDARPRPDQVVALVLGGRPIARSTTADGKSNITLGVPTSK